ncbi:MAG TPA: M81 family metallopeptidase [Casimicrobiaceae bacterium]|mgnify:CR=1 FL=1|nr:M81 family metallopeptidase [Casimicrobiaceae bacterium]
MRIAIGGFQHETNTFAPSKAGFDRFESGEGWPPLSFGDQVADRLDGANIPAAGAMRALHRAGHRTVGLAWAAANPSAQVTRDAFERIAGEIVTRLAAAGAVDGVYLDLHGAMVTEHLDDGEGELLARVRRVVGPKVPVVASLDLHANVTRAMLEHANALVAYRTYPHVDMASTGERAARMLDGMLATGAPLAKSAGTLDFLTGLPSQCTTIEPGRRLYAHLESLEREHGAVLSFAPGFPMADIPECGMTAFGMGPDDTHVQVAVAALRRAIADAEGEFRLDLYTPDDAVRRAVQRGAPGAPVVLADTQDNPGAGGNGDTTGLLSSLLRHDAPGSVLGLLIDPASAKQAHAVGERHATRFRLGEISGVPGHVPLEGEFIVEKLADGRFTCTGPMFRGFRMDLGPMALLRRGNVRVVLASVKCQAGDQAMFRHVGVEPREERVLALKSSVHFRADFEPIAREVLVVAAPGPARADPAAFGWKRLRAGLRLKPLGPAFVPPSL